MNSFSGSVTDDKNVMESLRNLFLREQAAEDLSAASIAIEFDLEKRHVFSEVAGYKLFLEDGSEMILNAEMSTFGIGSLVPALLTERFPINKSMTWLSNYLISNNQSLIFNSVPGEGKFDKAFYDLIAVFENLPGKSILKVVVFNQNNESIAEFSTIPALKRSFLIGVSPQQREFSELTKSAKWAGKHPVYHLGADRIVYFTENKTDYLQRRLNGNINEYRVVTIGKTGKAGLAGRF